MADSSRRFVTSTKPLRPVSHTTALDSAPTPADDPVLREALKRCSPSTYYAACKFRASADPADLALVVHGVIERFTERDLRAKLAAPAASLRLREDLGLDSLTMMEVVMLAEEVLGISVNNEELTHLRTLADVQAFIARKVTAPTAVRPASEPTPAWNVGAVAQSIRDLDAAALAPLPPRPTPSA